MQMDSVNVANVQQAWVMFTDITNFLAVLITTFTGL